MKFSCEGFTAKYETEVRDGFFFCRAGINIASVLVDGSISACPNIDREFAQGNIYNDNFMDVWENRFDIMRNRKWMKTGICKNCKMFKWCRGNGFGRICMGAVRAEKIGLDLNYEMLSWFLFIIHERMISD